MLTGQDAIAHIRRESLDIYNRLHSIAEDVVFVNLVQSIYTDLPLLPNLRCGAWYTDPANANSTPAYFKSTDGHYGNWTFNLRRPNMHLLPLIINHRGLILIDSTRAGKRMPDAFSKTVPIWCAVINRAIARITPDNSDHWDINLYTPPQVVSSQEHAQIEARLDGWANALIASSYKLPHLPYPLRPLWITPATSNFPKPPHTPQIFFPVFCVSVSKQISDGIERRASGYAYIQGSGDDHELWGMGLTPNAFWKHHDEILRASRLDLTAIIESIVSASSSPSANVDWAILPSSITKTAGKLLICSNSDLPSPLPGSLPGSSPEATSVAFLQICTSGGRYPFSSDGHPSPLTNHLLLEAPEGKRGQLHFLQKVLPQSIAFISRHLHMDSDICISCDTGRDISVGVTLVALQKFFDDAGRLISNDSVSMSSPGKQSIQMRLQWIISSHPQANPSRTTLKRVNEFLLTPAHFSRSTSVNSQPSPSLQH